MVIKIRETAPKGGEMTHYKLPGINELNTKDTVNELNENDIRSRVGRAITLYLLQPKASSDPSLDEEQKAVAIQKESEISKEIVMLQDMIADNGSLKAKLLDYLNTVNESMAASGAPAPVQDPAPASNVTTSPTGPQTGQHHMELDFNKISSEPLLNNLTKSRPHKPKKNKTNADKNSKTAANGLELETAQPAPAPAPVVNDSNKPVISEKDKVKNLSEHYKHSTINAGRNHLFTATSKNLSREFNDFKGDILKTKILLNFKEKLEGATNIEGLNKIVDDFKKSPEYTTLKTGQGITTRVLGLKTDSVKALEKMITSAQDGVTNKPNNSPK